VQTAEEFQARMVAFETTAATPVRDLWRYVVAHQSLISQLTTEGGTKPGKITAIFVSREAHAVGVKEYTTYVNGTVSELPIKIYGAEFAMYRDTTYVVTGVYAEAAAASANDPRLSGLEGVP